MEGITILNQTLHEGAIVDPLFMIGLTLIGAALLLGIVGAFMSSCKIKIIPYIFLRSFHFLKGFFFFHNQSK